MITPYHYLLISSILFGIGVYGILSKRNMVRILLSAEIIFNSALLALVSFTSFTKNIYGYLLIFLAVGIAAAEVGVIISLAILLYRKKGDIDIMEVGRLRG